MYQPLVTVALALLGFAAESQPGKAVGSDTKLPMVKLDGEWTVVCAEIDGKKADNATFKQVTIKGNVVTCNHDGKEKSWRIEFGPHHMIRCVETIDGKATSDAADAGRNTGEKGYHSHHGVYIASQDYFCMCLHKGRDRRSFGTPPSRDGKEERVPPVATGFNADQSAHGAHFVLILQRSGSATPPKR